MNTQSTAQPGDSAAEALLTLVMPPTLTDPLVDWLLEQPEVTGFISLPVNGHGGEVHAMSAAEQVAGYRKGWMVQTHLPQQQARELLARLAQDFAASEIHYWMTPLIAGGHLG
jgi:creatinine amidohydrolase/Fe(II)-dependent formamide hydrolase-like protein